MRKSIFFGLLIIIGIAVGFIIQPLFSDDNSNIINQEKKFDYVLNTIFKNYVDKVDTEKLVEAAIKGMLNELDVHSVYISAESMKRVQEDFQGSFEGIGVQFDIIEDTIIIISAIPGGPSEALGIQSGDKIITIDGENAVGMDREDVPKKLKGPKGTVVEVGIKRDGEPDLIHFSITRDKIPLNSVDAAFIIDGTDIGYVEVNRFAQITHQEMVDSLESLKQRGMKKIILDLRGNPGGYLNQAFLMADEFLPQGDTIVYTKGRKPIFDEVYISNVGGKFEKYPLIVLIDAGSASASEIVSGAIQDLDRGIIVGETSYGKGLVQRQFEIGDGSAFRLTISKYYTPSGRSIQRPYKDKDKYRNLVGRLELEEGSYLQNPIEKIRKQVEKLNEENKNKKDYKPIHIDSLPLYKTRSGRLVFGGGGITPDFIVKHDTITKLSVEIRKKNLYLIFADNFMHSEGKKVKEKYHSNFQDYYRNFKITDEIMEDFKKLAISKGIEWNEDQAKIDWEYNKTVLKAYLARSIWDRNKMTQILSIYDKQMQTAITLFPEAEKMLASKRKK
ncbi:MAG: S41 family peptidase [Candidatus Woesearchaeota archaeon]